MNWNCIDNEHLCTCYRSVAFVCPNSPSRPVTPRKHQKPTKSPSSSNADTCTTKHAWKPCTTTPEKWACFVMNASKLRIFDVTSHAFVCRMTTCSVQRVRRFTEWKVGFVRSERWRIMSRVSKFLDMKVSIRLKWCTTWSRVYRSVYTLLVSHFTSFHSPFN